MRLYILWFLNYPLKFLINFFSKDKHFFRSSSIFLLKTTFEKFVLILLFQTLTFLDSISRSQRITFGRQLSNKYCYFFIQFSMTEEREKIVTIIHMHYYFRLVFLLFFLMFSTKFPLFFKIILHEYWIVRNYERSITFFMNVWIFFIVVL